MILDFRPVHVRSVVDKVSLVEVFLRLLRCTPFCILARMLHSHLQLKITLFLNKRGKAFKYPNTAVFFSNNGEKKYVYFSLNFQANAVLCFPAVSPVRSNNIYSVHCA